VTPGGVVFRAKREVRGLTALNGELQRYDDEPQAVFLKPTSALADRIFVIAEHILTALPWNQLIQPA
jgi:hypothetical protein